MEHIIARAVEDMIREFVHRDGRLNDRDRQALGALKDACDKMLKIDESVKLLNEWEDAICDGFEEA